MSDLPPNIDAILASIRSRMTDDSVPPPPPEAPAPVAAPPPPPTADIGSVHLDGSATTIDTLIRSMLEPLVKAWLDANMPEIVEHLAQAEIKRLTGRD